jgi:hypothetical protein
MACERSTAFRAEFRLSIVERIKAGETVKQLSVESGIDINTINQWVGRNRCGKKFNKTVGRRKIVTTPVQQALQSYFETRCTPTFEDVRSKLQEELAITENSSEIKVSRTTAYMARKGLLESRHSLAEQPHFNNSKVHEEVVVKDTSPSTVGDLNVDENPNEDDNSSEVSMLTSKTKEPDNAALSEITLFGRKRLDEYPEPTALPKGQKRGITKGHRQLNALNNSTGPIDHKRCRANL